MSGSSGVLSSLIVNLVANIEGFQNGMNSAADSLSKAGAKMADLGKAWTQSVTAPILAGAAVIFSVANDFQDKMGEMAASVGMSEGAANKLGDALLKLAPALGKGPSELIDPLGQIIKAGFQGAEALAILEKAGRASAAGIGNLGGNVETLITYLKGAGKESRNASGGMDAMLVAAQTSRAKFEEFGGVLGKLGPSLKATGTDARDGAAALSVLTQSSGSLSVAGKQLKAMLTEIAEPSKKMADGLKSIGMTTADLEKSIAKNGLDKAMMMLGDRLKRTGKSMDDVFKSTAAVDAAMQLSNKSSERLVGTFDRVRNSHGALDRAFKTAGGPDKLEKTMALVQVGLVKLGDIVVPMVNKAIDFLNKKLEQAIKWWDGLSDETKQSIVNFALIAAAVGPLLVVFGGIVTALAWIVGAFATFFGWIAAGLTALKSLGALFGVLRVALMAITGPVGIVIGVIAGLVYYFWDEIPKAIQAAIKWFKFLGTDIGPALGKAWKTVSEGFAGLWKTLKKFGADVIKDIPSAFSKAFKSATKALSEFWKYLKGVDFSAIGVGLFEGLKAALSGLSSIISAGVVEAFDLLKTVFAGVVTSIKDLFVGFFDWTTGTIGELWSKLKSWFTGEASPTTSVTGDLKPVVDLLTQIRDLLNPPIKVIDVGGGDGDGDSGGDGGSGSGSGDGTDGSGGSSGGLRLVNAYTGIYASLAEAEQDLAMLTKAAIDQGLTVMNAIAEAAGNGTYMASYEAYEAVPVDPDSADPDSADPDDGCECAPWLEQILDVARAVMGNTAGTYRTAMELAAPLKMIQDFTSAVMSNTAGTYRVTMEVVAGLFELEEWLAAVTDYLSVLIEDNSNVIAAINAVGTKIGETTTAIQAMAADITSINDHFTGQSETVIPVDGSLTQAITQTITFTLDSRILAEAVAEHFPDVLTLNGA